MSDERSQLPVHLSMREAKHEAKLAAASMFELVVSDPNPLR